MMRAPPRHLSRILEVCSDIKEALMTENLWFDWFSAQTRSRFSPPLSQSLWKIVIIAALDMMSACWLLPFTYLLPVDISLIARVTDRTLSPLLLCRWHISSLRSESPCKIHGKATVSQWGGMTCPLLLLLFLLSASNTQPQSCVVCTRTVAAAQTSILMRGQCVSCVQEARAVSDTMALLKPWHVQLAGCGASRLTSYFYS